MNNLQTKAYPSLKGFGGINTGQAPFNIQDMEATDMLNISSDDFPALTQPKAPVMIFAGMKTILFVGILFDGSWFCVGQKATDLTRKIYWWFGDAWEGVGLGDGVQTWLTSSTSFAATRFSDSQTILATGFHQGQNNTGLLSIRQTDNWQVGDPIYTAYKVVPEDTEPIPLNVDFVATKAERLLTASSFTDILGASEYQQVHFINADDFQLFHLQTEQSQFTTGLTVYKDYALCFKRNTTYILYGKTPDSYSLDILSGSVGCVENKTIAETNAGLMWLAADGVYMYSATTLPYKISEPIQRYIDKFLKCDGYSAAASDGKKYYLSLQQDELNSVLCVFDTVNKVWDVEENAGYTMFVEADNLVYGYDGQNIYNLNQEDFTGHWYFITKPFDLSGASGKVNLHKFYLSIRAKRGAVLEVYISPDIDGDRFINVHRQLFLKDYDGKIPVLIPNDANFRGINYFRIKLSGQKKCVIYALDAELRIKRGTY